MTARDELRELVEDLHRAGCCPHQDADVNASIDAEADAILDLHAHELAERIRDAAEIGDDFHEAADLIDPEEDG